MKSFSSLYCNLVQTSWNIRGFQNVPYCYLNYRLKKNLNLKSLKKMFLTFENKLKNLKIILKNLEKLFFFIFIIFFKIFFFKFFSSLYFVHICQTILFSRAKFIINEEPTIPFGGYCFFFVFLSPFYRSFPIFYFFSFTFELNFEGIVHTTPHSPTHLTNKSPITWPLWEKTFCDVSFTPFQASNVCSMTSFKAETGALLTSGLLNTTGQLCRSSSESLVVGGVVEVVVVVVGGMV